MARGPGGAGPAPKFFASVFTILGATFMGLNLLTDVHLVYLDWSPAFHKAALGEMWFFAKKVWQPMGVPLSPNELRLIVGWLLVLGAVLTLLPWTRPGGSTLVTVVCGLMLYSHVELADFESTGAGDGVPDDRWIFPGATALAAMMNIFLSSDALCMMPHGSDCFQRPEKKYA